MTSSPSSEPWWWLGAEGARAEADAWRTPSAWWQLDPPAPAEYEEDPR